MDHSPSPAPVGAPVAEKENLQAVPAALPDTHVTARVSQHDARRHPRYRGWLLWGGKTAATIGVFAIALLAALVIWDYYILAPWTRNGTVRVQVASIAPQVSGQISQVRVVDNQYVHKGDVLYSIDPFDFQVSLATARTQLRMKAADLQVKREQAERRLHLTDLATTPEEQQQYQGNSIQAEAAFDSAQQQVNQSEINLKRTQVESPVNGFITNLLMRVGDYAHAGTTNISVIDADSYWIDGYFEETKMARVCIGDQASIQLMGYRQPILGQVKSVTRGISVSNAAPSTQGLPNVDPVYTWVRLAQRVPVRIAITQVPEGVPLVSGMTATVTILDAEKRNGETWLERRFSELGQRIRDVLQQPEPKPACVPAIGSDSGQIVSIPELKPSGMLTPSEINPGLAPGLAKAPTAQ